MQLSTGPDRIAETSPHVTDLETLKTPSVKWTIDVIPQEKVEENYASAMVEKNSESPQWFLDCV